MKNWEVTEDHDVLDEKGTSILQCDDPYCAVFFKEREVAVKVAALPAIELSLRTILECETLEQAKANAEVGLKFLMGEFNGKPE